ncbi:MAG: hypothetical protein RLO21_09810 [Nitratireductor sp.]
MAKYILNQNKQDSQSGQNHELHNESPGACSHLPARENRLEVGNFSNCHDAMAEAKRKYPSMAADIDGCYYCCSACHKE